MQQTNLTVRQDYVVEQTGSSRRTFDVSSPAWPEPLRSKENTPNVLFIIMDDTGSPVCDKVQPPFKFTSTLCSVTVDVSGELITDDEAALRAVMARQ